VLHVFDFLRKKLHLCGDKFHYCSPSYVGVIHCLLFVRGASLSGDLCGVAPDCHSLVDIISLL